MSERREPAGATVVALHGFGGSGPDFDVLVDRTPDLSWLAPDVADWEPTLPLADVALGYSMGARAVLAQAVQKRLRVRGIVLVSGTAGIADVDKRRARAEADRQLAARIIALGARAFAETWRAHPLIRSQNATPEPYLSAMANRRSGQPTARLVAMLERWGQGVFEPLWDRLAEVRVPTLVVAGDNDPAYCAVAERLASALPDARLAIVAGAGHAPHLERPGAFLATVAPFIRASR